MKYKSHFDLSLIKIQTNEQVICTIEMNSQKRLMASDGAKLVTNLKPLFRAQCAISRHWDVALEKWIGW
jgi:hypothetical protein